MPNLKTVNGYVLLMVLVLLTVIVTALSSIATRTMRTTQEAVIAVAQLQQRVGIASCRNALLEKAFFVFKDLDTLRRDGHRLPSAESNYIVSDSIMLGEQTFNLVLSDENSKVNLNAMHFHSGPEKVFQTLRRTLPVHFARAVRLQPAANANRSNELPSEDSTKSTAASPDVPQEGGKANGNLIESETESSTYIAMIPAFRSWGEVFSFEALVGQELNRHSRLEFTKSFTLWGSGQLNVLRASDASILTQMEAVIPSAKAKVILNAIREASDFNIQNILEAEVQSVRQRQRLQALLGKDSYAFSLFINVDSSQARSRQLFTISPDENGTQEIQSFQFR